MGRHSQPQGTSTADGRRWTQIDLGGDAVTSQPKWVFFFDHRGHRGHRGTQRKTKIPGSGPRSLVFARSSLRTGFRVPSLRSLCSLRLNSHSLPRRLPAFNRKERIEHKEKDGHRFLSSDAAGCRAVCTSSVRLNTGNHAAGSGARLTFTLPGRSLLPQCAPVPTFCLNRRQRRERRSCVCVASRPENAA